MPENNPQTLFAPATAPQTSSPILVPAWSSPINTGWLSGWLDMSQNEKDAILRQIHPIFLTAHSEEKGPIHESNFDKFLGFMRLCLEWILKLVDILVDAVIQVARLTVWIVAITGVLIVVTLMTNTTDKFIDLLNESIFKAFGIETRIEKVPSTENTNPVVPSTTGQTDLKSESISDGSADTATETQTRRRRVSNIDNITTTDTVDSGQ